VKAKKLYKKYKGSWVAGKWLKWYWEKKMCRRKTVNVPEREKTK